MNSLKNMFIITVLIFSVLFSLINICSGEDKAVKKYQEEIVYPKHYPNKFNGMGHIDRISRNEIVIDDSLFTIPPSPEFASFQYFPSCNIFYQGKTTCIKGLAKGWKFYRI